MSDDMKDTQKEEDQKKETKEETNESVESKTEDKSAEKEKSLSKNEETKNKDDDNEDEEESEEELPPGLLEKPVEILKDKRERKKVTRFSYDDVPAPTPDKKKFEIKEGSGEKLGDHPRVEWHLKRNKVEDLKIIHKLFFGVFGDTYTCKKNIRNFSGFAFEKDSPEYEKKEEYIGRFTMDNLKWALTVCDVQYTVGKKKKDDLIDVLLEWCLCPKPSGKPIPEKKKRGEKRTKKKRRKSKTTNKESSENNTSTLSLSSDSSSSESEDAESKEELPKESPKKSSPKKRKPTAGKSEPKKKMAKIKIGQSKKFVVSDSSDSDAPLQRKAKPSDAQIRKSVEKVLKGANLEEITMKNVCTKIYSLYPEIDLSDKKQFIKETVKKIIS